MQFPNLMSNKQELFRQRIINLFLVHNAYVHVCNALVNCENKYFIYNILLFLLDVFAMRYIQLNHFICTEYFGHGELTHFSENLHIFHVHC